MSVFCVCCLSYSVLFMCLGYVFYCSEDFYFVQLYNILKMYVIENIYCITCMFFSDSILCTQWEYPAWNQSHCCWTKLQAWQRCFNARFPSGGNIPLSCVSYVCSLLVQFNNCSLICVIHRFICLGVDTLALPYTCKDIL